MSPPVSPAESSPLLPAYSNTLSLNASTCVISGTRMATLRDAVSPCGHELRRAVGACPPPALGAPRNRARGGVPRGQPGLSGQPRCSSARERQHEAPGLRPVRGIALPERLSHSEEECLSSCPVPWALKRCGGLLCHELLRWASLTAGSVAGHTGDSP